MRRLFSLFWLLAALLTVWACGGGGNAPVEAVDGRLLPDSIYYLSGASELRSVQPDGSRDQLVFAIPAGKKFLGIDFSTVDGIFFADGDRLRRGTSQFESGAPAIYTKRASEQYTAAWLDLNRALVYFSVLTPSTGSSVLYSTPLSGGGAAMVVIPAFEYVQLSPDRSLAVFSDSTGMYLQPLPGGTPSIVVIPPSAEPARPESISPSNDRIVFSARVERGAGPQLDVFLYTVSTGTAVRMTVTNTNETGASFNGDATRISFWNQSESALEVMNADGSGRRKILSRSILGRSFWTDLDGVSSGLGAGPGSF